ncbi:MAG: hypothetical protein LBV03_00020, partial [Fusobacteriales bacterium]|nr:hypothetical protein [Fusobacteriales bacterium]
NASGDENNPTMINVTTDNYISGVLTDYELPADASNQENLIIRWRCTDTEGIGVNVRSFVNYIAINGKGIDGLTD